MGVALMQGVPNRCQYTIEIPENLIIPESQDTDALFIQPACPFRIGCSALLGIVLPAIQFYRQLCRRAIKIQYKVSDGMLFTELETIQLFTAQALPQQLLGIRHVFA